MAISEGNKISASDINTIVDGVSTTYSKYGLSGSSTTKVITDTKTSKNHLANMISMINACINDLENRKVDKYKGGTLSTSVSEYLSASQINTLYNTQVAVLADYCNCNEDACYAHGCGVHMTDCNTEYNCPLNCKDCGDCGDCCNSDCCDETCKDCYDYGSMSCSESDPTPGDGCYQHEGVCTCDTVCCDMNCSSDGSCGDCCNSDCCNTDYCGYCSGDACSSNCSCNKDRCGCDAHTCTCETHKTYIQCCDNHCCHNDCCNITANGVCGDYDYDCNECDTDTYNGGCSFADDDTCCNTYCCDDHQTREDE